MFSNCEPVFVSPFNSRSIDIFKDHLSGGQVQLNTLSYKALTYAIYHGYVVFIKPLHSLTTLHDVVFPLFVVLVKLVMKTENNLNV